MKTYRRYYDKMLELLVDETEYSKEDILSSKDEDCVNIRIVMIYLMSEAGVTDRNIQSLTGFTQQMISRNKMLFQDRYQQSQTIRILTKITRSFIKKCIEHFRQQDTQET